MSWSSFSAWTTLRGRIYYLVRWQGHASADDSWWPEEHPAQRPERIAEYEVAGSTAQSASGPAAPDWRARRGAAAAAPPVDRGRSAAPSSHRDGGHGDTAAGPAAPAVSRPIGHVP